MVEQALNEGSLADKFEKVRDSLWGHPGFLRRNSTIVLTKGFLGMAQETWIVETIKTDDSLAIFLQVINKDGGQRIILPKKVCDAIYIHHEKITRVRRQVRAQRGAETRRMKKVEKE